MTTPATTTDTFAAIRPPGLPTGVRALLIVAALVVILAGMRAAANVLAPLVLATFVAIVSLPVLRMLQTLRVPTLPAILLVVLLDMMIIGSLGWIVVRTVLEMRDAAPLYIGRLQVLETAALTRLRDAGFEVQAIPYAEVFQPERIFELAATTLRRVMTIAAFSLLVMLYLIFTLAESVGLPQKMRLAFGAGAEDMARFGQVVREVQRYLALKTVICLATGLVIGVANALLGVDFALFWGFLAFVLNYVPNVGSLIAAVPAVLVALLQLGPGVALGLALIYLVVNLLLGSLVDPILVGRRLGLSTLVVLLSLVVWGSLWGIIGMFLALPLTAAVKIALESSDRLRPIAVLMGPVPVPVKPRAHTEARRSAG